MNKTLLSLKLSIAKARRKKLELGEKLDEDKAMYDFKEREKIYLQKTIASQIKQIEKTIDDPIVSGLRKAQNYEEMAKAVEEIQSIKPKEDDFELKITIPVLPSVIKEEINLDVKEMQYCFHHGLYRSATIMCGRILEVALHRKYYEVTEKDILETNPGIGLGKLIAKLKEKEVEFAPGVTEQIHLVNQVRVESVHKKTKVFKPTKEQTQATILYSMDVLKKLF